MIKTQVVADSQAAASTVPKVTMVATAGCHFCEDAHAHLVDLAARGSLTLQVVGADSPVGGRLVATHRPAMFPLVLVSERYFSSGRLPRRKLQRLLAPTGAG